MKVRNDETISGFEQKIIKEILKYEEKEFEKLVVVISANLADKMKCVNIRLNINKNYDFPIEEDDEFEDNTFEVELDGA
jgi:hypothetical protein